MCRSIRFTPSNHTYLRFTSTNLGPPIYAHVSTLFSFLMLYTILHVIIFHVRSKVYIVPVCSACPVQLHYVPWCSTLYVCPILLQSTGYTQKNGVVSKVNKKFISHFTRTQRTPSAVATVRVSHALPAIRFSCLLRGQFPRWRRSRKRLSVCSVLRCPDLWLQYTKLTRHCNHRSGHLKTELTESLFLLRRHLRNWPRGPAVSMRSELLVAHEKLGQLLLLAV